MRKIKSHHQATTFRASVAIAVVLILVVGLAVLAAYGRRKAAKTVSASPSPVSTAASPAVTVQPGQSINPGTETSTPSASPTSAASTRPVASTMAAPTGQLLSSSSVSLSGSNAEESVCQTVIGATCLIFVTSPAGQTASFAAPSTDDQGGHLVDWTAKQYADAAGIWKIYAQASLNGQFSSSPAYNFTVTQ
jgi:hypothetical protein